MPSESTVNPPYRPWALPQPLPLVELVTSFPQSSPWYQAIDNVMMQAEREYSRHLLEELDCSQVPGAIIEFGVFGGGWLSHLAAFREALGSAREVWGFDSFEGLPAPTRHDLNCWHEGQYAASFDEVAELLRADERPWLHLEKGWFAESLLRPPVQAIGSVAFARIDCDLYEPAVECLAFLTDRLPDHAILVFDDWTYNHERGETKAFLEWQAVNPSIKTEFLLANGKGHVYFRVRRS